MSSESGPVRGRPRDQGVEGRILDAALKHLTEDGFDGMSMAQVARTAGVSKPTIYLRWPSKESLAVAAVAGIVAEATPDHEAGVWPSLVAELRQYFRLIRRANGLSFLGMLLAESERRPELLSMYRQQVSAVRRGRIADVLRRGQESGEINPDIEPSELVNVLMGHFYASYIGGGVVADDWPEYVVEMLRPLLVPNASVRDGSAEA
jgi:AcrR family transcriptional regulator